MDILYKIAEIVDAQNKCLTDFEETGELRIRTVEQLQIYFSAQMAKEPENLKRVQYIKDLYQRLFRNPDGDACLVMWPIKASVEPDR